MNKALLFLMVICLTATLSSLSFAQESGLLESEYSTGKVIDVSEKQITISQYDYESQDMVEVSYAITENTAIENATLQDITNGDQVEIIYAADGSNKVAKNITVQKENTLTE